jgi:hypothetical protein
MPEIVGEYVDRLCTVEMRMLGLPRGVTHLLYESARRVQDAPLAFLAARRILERVGGGDVVMFLTGAGVMPWLPAGETDGPLGAVSLARAVIAGLGAEVVYVSEERHLRPIEAASAAAGIPVIDVVERATGKPSSMALSFPPGAGTGTAGGGTVA